MKHRRPPRSVGAKTERCAVYHAGGHRRRRACGTRRPDLRLCRSQRTILWRWGGGPPPRRLHGSRAEKKKGTAKRKKKRTAAPRRPAPPVLPPVPLAGDGGVAACAPPRAQ